MTVQLGQFQIEVLSDGGFGLDGGQMFGVVPKVMWEKELPADAQNRVYLGLTCLLVKAGPKKVLIETGIGDKFDAKFADVYAVDRSTNLLAELAREGVRPDEVDIVINTHLHFDHCGWNTRQENGRTVPTFPRARYFIQRGEWNHALQPSERDRASYRSDFFVDAEHQTDFLDGDAEIIPGIQVEVVPGHVRDLQCVWIESEGESACFISDLVPTTAHLRYPWIMAFDLYPLDTLAGKKRLLPKLAERGSFVIFPHDRRTPVARVAEVAGEIRIRT